MKKYLIASVITLAMGAAFAAELPVLPPVPGSAAKVPTKKVAEQAMPGVGVMPGDKSDLAPNVVRVVSGQTEIRNASNLYPNRIATPFAAPRVIDAGDAEIKYEGQSVYVLPKGTAPIGLFVTGNNPNDPVVSLTLVPKAIPQQTIVLQLDAAARVNGEKTEPVPAATAYEERLRYALRQVALGKTPDGFTEGALPSAVATVGSVVVRPLVRFSGSAFDIYKYRVENRDQATVELDEAAFYSDGVRAVAFFPQVSLRRGESTTVFVVADKTATEVR